MENINKIIVESENENETKESFQTPPPHPLYNDTLVERKKEENGNQYFLCQKLDEAVYDAPPSVEFRKEVDKSKEEKEKIFLFDMNNAQKEKAEKLKIDKIIENEIYLKKNKVLKYIIQIFLSDLLKEKPEDVYSFAVTYFTRSNLKQYISEKLKETLKR